MDPARTSVCRFVSPLTGQDLTVHCTSEAEAAFLFRKIFEEEEYGHVEYKKGGLIVDCGGNIGVFSLYAAERTGGSARIVAFEPVPALCSCLAANAVQAAEAVDIRRRAVSDVSGQELVFDYLPRYTLLSGIAAAGNKDVYAAAAGAGRQAEVEAAFHAVAVRATTVTLIEALADYQREIDLLKIDVEGMEHLVRPRPRTFLRPSTLLPLCIPSQKVPGSRLGPQVLAGMDTALFARTNQLIVEVHDIGDRVRELQETLCHHGFVVAVGPLAPPSFLLGEGVAPRKGLSTCNLTATRPPKAAVSAKPAAAGAAAAEHMM
eukprot:SAG22_NODE_169_length_16721_cov_6.494104_10_plen_319_part_00